MIIDPDLYIGEFPFAAGPRCSASDLARTLKSSGIKKGLVTPLAGIFNSSGNFEIHSDFLKEISPYSGLLYPVLALNPMLQDWEETLNYFGPHAVGVKLFFRHHGYALFDQVSDKVLRKTAKLGIPVILSARLIDERTLPSGLVMSPPVAYQNFIELADRHPDIRFLISCLNAYEAMNVLAAKRNNVYIDTSFMDGEGIFIKHLENGHMTKILFGSHFPFFYIESAIVKLHSANFFAAIKELAGHKNATSLFDSL